MRRRSVVLLAVVLAGVVMICGIGSLAVLAVNPFFSPDRLTATTQLSPEQAAQCRYALGLRPAAPVTFEYYAYRDGFLDDQLTCRFRAARNELTELFDPALVDVQRADAQPIRPGEHLRLRIEQLDADTILVTGEWYTM
ncbi:hypothetical protein [Chloroflexus islandicus]|uniref:hypothetical protein n=1 Tax=Chloroflexus islandicus TaxID=1707952 RepID=UPI0012E8035D|nr:hypothetical protein [Chloroflexus islandicus]